MILKAPLVPQGRSDVGAQAGRTECMIPHDIMALIVLVIVEGRKPANSFCIFYTQVNK